MQLIFFDEVKSQPNHPYYHIGAICIDEPHLKMVETEINQISQELFNNVHLNRNTEFHAADIYHKKKAFKAVEPADRNDILIRLFQILAKPEVKLIDIHINLEKLLDKRGMANKDPKDLAFMFLCEKANALMKAEKAMGMLIGDRESDPVSERFSIGLSHYRARGTDFSFGTDISHLFESVHFTHSHLSRFLQLADVYAWQLQFWTRNRRNSNPGDKYLIELYKAKEINLFPSKYRIWPT